MIKNTFYKKLSILFLFSILAGFSLLPIKIILNIIGCERFIPAIVGLQSLLFLCIISAYNGNCKPKLVLLISTFFTAMTMSFLFYNFYVEVIYMAPLLVNGFITLSGKIPIYNDINIVKIPDFQYKSPLQEDNLYKPHRQHTLFSEASGQPATSSEQTSNELNTSPGQTFALDPVLAALSDSTSVSRTINASHESFNRSFAQSSGDKTSDISQHSKSSTIGEAGYDLTSYSTFANDMEARCLEIARAKTGNDLGYINVTLKELGLTKNSREHKILMEAFPKYVGG